MNDTEPATAVQPAIAPSATLPARRRKSGGRKTKYEPGIVRRVCKGLARGLPVKHATAAAGISHETFYKWLKQHRDFEEAIAKAVAEGTVARLKTIEDAAKAGDWRASAWLLEHCQPEHFAKSRIQVEAVGALEHTFVIPQETLNEIAEARKRHEQKQLEANGA